MNILKLSKAYMIASTSTFMLFMFHFSLYFPLMYLQIFMFSFLNIYGVLPRLPILDCIHVILLLNNHSLVVKLNVVILLLQF